MMEQKIRKISRLELARRTLGLRQIDLELLSGVPRHRISTVENGLGRLSAQEKFDLERILKVPGELLEELFDPFIDTQRGGHEI